MTGDDTARLIYLVILLGAVAGGVFFRRDILARENLRNAGIWGLVVLVLLTAYVVRDDIAAELRPSAARATESGAYEIRRSANGQFLVDAEVRSARGEARVNFLVDTGASSVALSAADARRMGIEVSRLNYSLQVMTANGTTLVAPVRLEEIRIGDIAARNIAATVHRDGLDQSLLGMSFLNRLERYSVSRDTLILAD
ncbi:MAG: TIGR02281 family clan AA aspartic protease [Pseudomonadota bacterium]